MKLWPWKRQETARERALRKGRKALSGFRKDSAWLKVRPFADKYDGDDIRYKGY